MRALEGEAERLCRRRDLRPDGEWGGSIAAEFAPGGVHFHAARKADRITGWNVMRRLLQDAGKPDVPGLYIARHAEYFWELSVSPWVVQQLPDSSRWAALSTQTRRSKPRRLRVAIDEHEKSSVA